MLDIVKQPVSIVMKRYAYLPLLLAGCACLFLTLEARGEHVFMDGAAVTTAVLGALDRGVTNVGASPSNGRTWYVRPSGGNYGHENGTSYEDAWDGLLNAVWGGDGVEAGDTLYVCGLHLHVMHKREAPIASAIHPVTGLSETQRVTIRGDYPGDPGIIWGACGVRYEDWRDETGNLWSITAPSGKCYADWFFQDIAAEEWIILDKEESVDAAGSHPGSFYYDAEGTNRLYVRLTDSGNPTDRVYLNTYGYSFDLDTLRHVAFVNLKLYNMTCFCRASWDVCSIEWNGCTFLYGDYFILRFYEGHHNMRIIDCEIGWGGNGIYTIGKTDESPKRFMIRGNHIHDIGVRAANQNRDAHAIGLQGPCYFQVEGNLCENVGTGVSLYGFAEQQMRNNIIRRNIVRDTHMIAGANSRGVDIICDNDSLSDKTGNLFCQNIAINTDTGYLFTPEDEQKVFNNIAYNCKTGFSFIRSYAGYGPDVRLRNNIAYGSTDYHMLYLSSSSETTMVDSDYNVFYPDGPSLFQCNGQGGRLQDWQTFSPVRFVFDPHSRIADPCFVDPNALNFRLRRDSPCRDTGVEIGLVTDFEGYPIPQGVSPDVGVYEQYPICSEASLLN